MRDLAVFLIVFGSIPYILRNPYIGVLVWSWLGYMNPHRLGWGAAYNFPFAQLVAGVLLVAMFLDKEKKSLPKSWILVVWLMFLLWGLITTLNAYHPENAMNLYIKIIKIQVIIYVAMMIMTTPDRIRLMIWVVFFSIGFFGIKGGIYTIQTAGGGRVWGPPGSFIEDNNELAIALLMVLPLGYYLIKHEVKNVWIKRLLWTCMPLIAISVVGSQSRGAFLSIICVALYLWTKTRKKLVTAMLILPLLPLMFFLMPQSWHDRMGTIQNYEEDRSAMGRINAWQYAINVANDRITGAGLKSWSGETFAIWAPDPSNVHAAHSIYFGVLGDHGWFGLVLFVAIFLGGFLLARRIALNADQHEEFLWAADLARMIQVSLVAYGTGGAFLSLAYFDLPWHLIGIVLLLQQVLRKAGVWKVDTRAIRTRNDHLVSG